MNILFLCHRIPYPPNKGDKIRSFHELVFLSRKHKIYLGTTLDAQSDEAYIDTLKTYCRDVCAVRFNRTVRLVRGLLSGRPFSVSNFYDKRLQAFVDRVLQSEKIDAVICACSSMAEYVFRNPQYRTNHLAGTKLIMDFVDLDSDKWLQYAAYSRFPLNFVYRLENKRLLEYEIEINRIFDHSVFVSDREVKVFERLYPGASKVLVIPNGVDYDMFVPKKIINGEESPSDKAGPVLVFTGFMSYFANEDGVKWFCERIFPIIRHDYPNAQFYIVGNQPSAIVRRLSRVRGVTVTGYVEDIRQYYWMADVYVTPLRIARGLQNKVLEAMATGNAVVASSNASDGIICHQNEDIVIADSESDFAAQVIDLLRNEERRRRIQEAAARNIREYYSWDRNLQAFDELLKDGE